MSKLLTFLSIVLFFVILTNSNAQVIITYDNYPTAVNLNDTALYTSANPSGIAIPEEGPDKLWDYSNLVYSSFGTNTYMEISGDMDFENAANQYTYNLYFQGMLIPTVRFDAIDSEGLYSIGTRSEASMNSITAITGGANDSLNFMPFVDKFEGRLNKLAFPVNYMDQWSGTYTRNVPYNITVEAYNLDNVPGNRKFIISETREVTGWGKIIMADESGNPTSPIDALQIKVTRTQTDSIFLGGQPLAPQFLDAFGLIQGDVYTSKNYFYYTPGFSMPVMDVSFGDGVNITRVYYRPQAQVLSSVDREFVDFKGISYPNPATAGKLLTLKFDDIITDLQTVRIYQINGSLVHSEEINSISDEISINLPQSILPGNYLFEIMENGSQKAYRGKFQVVN